MGARMGAKKRLGRRGTAWGLSKKKPNSEGETPQCHGKTMKKWTNKHQAGPDRVCRDARVYHSLEE